MSNLKKLIQSEISDFFAGFGSPGEPATPEEMQTTLQANIERCFADYQLDLLSIYGDGWYDGFLNAVEVSADGADIWSYTECTIRELSEEAESQKITKVIKHCPECGENREFHCGMRDLTGDDDGLMPAQFEVCQKCGFDFVTDGIVG